MFSRLLEARVGEFEEWHLKSPAGEVRVVGLEGIEESSLLEEAGLGALAVVEDEGFDVVLADVLAEVAETI